jgi:hypothetical protein
MPGITVRVCRGKGRHGERLSALLVDVPMLVVVIALGVWIGCSRPDLVVDTELGRQQRESLTHIFYRDNTPPPAPTPQEIRLAREAMRDSEPWERELLEAIYPDDPELWAYATRDSDEDGVFDFRVSDHYGRFLEGDTDLDGDGLDNVLDQAPYEAADEGGVREQIPAQLDWAELGKPAEMAQIQRDLFNRNRILLVERSADFTPELAQSVSDVVTKVYKEIFGDNGVLPTLRVVATEESSLLDPTAEEGASDFAQVLPATQTLEIYRRGIDAPPAIQLGFLAHEIAHNIQFSLDYDAQRQEEIIRRNYFAAAHFFDLVEPYGWTIVPTELNPEAEFSLFRPQYVSQEPYDYLYMDESIEDWENWLAAIYEEVGEEAYLTDQRIVEAQILGDYSLSGPWEWYSDEVIAYVYLAMLDSLRGRCQPAEWEALGMAFQNETVAVEWPYFRFENARGAEIQIHLRQVYPMDPADVVLLAENYLLATQPQYCVEQ